MNRFTPPPGVLAPRPVKPRGTVKRRVVFGSVAGVAALTAVPTWLWLATDSDATGESNGTDGTDVQIVAHPDDDLYFVNPDLLQSITQGRRVVSIYVTGGENDGRNGDVDQADYAGYVAARYEGLRAAYADMATGDASTKWQRKSLKLPGGIRAEQATLSGNVQLIFLNLWENSARQPGSNGKRLMDLWTGKTKEHHTLTPSGAPVKKSHTYDRATLVTALAEILATLNPRCVRTLDPDPDPQQHDAQHPQYADQDGYSDHIDHTAVALFAYEAIRKWRDENAGAAGAVVEPYRGYYNRRWPRNLSADAYDEKSRALTIYAWQDNRSCQVEAGCGDMKIGGDPIADHSYGASTIARYPASTSWWQSNADGRLFASTVHLSGVNRWLSDDTDGAVFSRVVSDPGSLVLPATCLTPVGADAWFEFAVAASFGPRQRDTARRLLVRSFAFSGAQGDWRDLGNPEGSDPKRGRLLGAPAATRLSDGRVMVAVRDFDRGVSIRLHSPSQGWDDWQRLDSDSPIQDGLAVLAGPDGLTEIFGCAENGVAHWRYTPDADWSFEVLDSGGAPVATPTVVALGKERTLLLTREAETAKIWAYLRDKGSWINESSLGGDGGLGPVAAVAPSHWDGRVALAASNDSGNVSLAVLGKDGETLEHDWTAGGPLGTRAPGLAVDPSGRVTAAILAKDGNLHIARQSSSGVGLPKGWTAVATGD